MLTKSQQKTKSYSIAAIMDNPKLSKLFGDALDSSLGSTKREKARSVLRSLTGIQGNYFNDGQGGPGDLPVTDQPYNPYGTNLNVAEQPAPAGAQLQPQGDVHGLLGPGEGVPPVPQPKAPFLFTAAPAVKDPSTVDQPGTGTTTVGTGATGEPGAAGTPGTGYKVPDDIRSQFPSVFEAVEAGVGPKTFRQSVFVDDAKRAELFPGVPANAMPEIPAMFEDELRTTLKEELQIDQLKNKVQELETLGLQGEEDTILSNDLEDYITSRDQYLNKVETMIESAKQHALDSDLANPHVNKMHTSYLNYLNVLKGRQQKRYSDFLSDSIAYHDNKLTRAQTAYKNASDLFLEQFNSKAKINEERYKDMSAILEEMYTNVASREKTFYETEKLRLDNLETIQDMGLSSVGGLTPFPYTAYMNDPEVALAVQHVTETGDLKDVSVTDNLRMKTSAVIFGKFPSFQDWLNSKGIVLTIPTDAQQLAIFLSSNKYVKQYLEEKQKMKDAQETVRNASKAKDDYQTAITDMVRESIQNRLLEEE